MNSYAENLRRSIVNTTRRFKEMTDELKAKRDAADREEIIRMAREAGMPPVEITSDKPVLYPVPDAIERFAALVATAEREYFVALVKEMDGPDGIVPTDDLLAAIRARGEK